MPHSRDTVSMGRPTKVLVVAMPGSATVTSKSQATLMKIVMNQVLPYKFQS